MGIMFDVLKKQKLSVFEFKLLSGRLPLNSNLNQSYQTDSACSKCGQKETTSHFIQCRFMQADLDDIRYSLFSSPECVKFAALRETLANNLEIIVARCGLFGREEVRYMLQQNVPRSAIVSLSRRSLKEFCHAAKRAWKHRCIVNVRRPGFREYRERRTLSSTQEIWITLS
jgi:hypothetical protein